jgi:signal transduction histidine kinase
VAAYRIVLEALTNVARHADADNCRIRLGFGPELLIEVVDDGRGVTQGSGDGVGLASMRERAAELGGECVVEPGPAGGTRVRARLPLVPGAAEG